MILYIFVIFICNFYLGRPRQTDQYPDTSVQGVPIAISYNLTVSIMSNPPPNVTTWTFVDYNGTLYGDLPDNVYAYTQPAPERLTMEAVLNITNTQDGNYGNYSMMSANDYGAMTVNFTILPRSEYWFDIFDTFGNLLYKLVTKKYVLLLSCHLPVCFMLCFG